MREIKWAGVSAVKTLQGAFSCRDKKLTSLMMHSCLFNLLFLALLIFSPSSSSEGDDCVFRDVSPAVASIACAVERGAWFISSDSSAIRNVACLLGAHRCSKKRSVPTENEITPSPLPPPAKNEQYQALASKAEEIVPKTWWRVGFADQQLLLTMNDSELPRKQFDVSKRRNKKLKNLLQCVTRQQFIRKSLSFDKNETYSEAGAPECTAMTDPVVTSFLAQWQTGDNNENFGGKIVKESGSQRMVWGPAQDGDGKLLVSALQVLDHFYANYGSVWTGCFRLEKSPSCRGALAGESINDEKFQGNN